MEQLVEYWPAAGEWERSTDGWDVPKLDAALEMARSANSTDVAIVQSGRLVADVAWTANAAGFEVLPGGRVRQDVASVQKSVTSNLAGIAVQRCALDIDASVTSYLGAGWAGAAAPPSESRITVRHLLSMTSGLADDMSYVAEPGSRWDYNLGAGYHTAKRVIAAVAGQPLEALTGQWLTGPLDMNGTAWVPRQVWDGMPPALRASSVYPDGKPIEGLATTALDLARFGLAVLRSGRSRHGPLGIDPGYAAEMLRPSQAMNPAYGLLWWLNGQERFLAPKNETVFEGRFLPGLPDGAFAALGAEDRMCVVVPGMDLVITRAGAAAGAPSLGPSAFVRAFSAAVCAAWTGSAARPARM